MDYGIVTSNYIANSDSALLLAVGNCCSIICSSCVLALATNFAIIQFYVWLYTLVCRALSSSALIQNWLYRNICILSHDKLVLEKDPKAQNTWKKFRLKLSRRRTFPPCWAPFSLSAKVPKFFSRGLKFIPWWPLCKRGWRRILLLTSTY